MEVDETPVRPTSTQKRRSTFFRRRSTLQFNGGDAVRNVCNDEKPDSRIIERIHNVDVVNNDETKKEEPLFDLEKYIDDLKKEREMWRQTFQDRRRQRKSISKQMCNTPRGEQDLDLSGLSDTERNFLLVRPNYEHIFEKAKKLSVMATETFIMSENVTHLHKRCISRAEKKLDDLTTRIIKLVD